VAALPQQDDVEPDAPFTAPRPTMAEMRAAAAWGHPARIVDAPPLVSPPTDAELYWYLGPQRRWVQLSMTGAFALAAVSLARFSLQAWWLYPLLGVLAVSVVGSILSLVSGLNRRDVSVSSHTELVGNWTMTRRTDAPSVDVFLPCCGEDLAVLRNTYMHVALMKWRGDLTVWVLDDGASAAVAALAEEFGFEYVVRPDRGHLKKAGNLRHAFSISRAEFIVILDADFSPRHDFLDHTVPYLNDASVAIVQTPQYFGTTHTMNWLERTAGATQELFYRWVQPSRDRANATICVGTCAVYRRSALDETGGFAEIEHSEDIHTGLNLIRAGYSVKYVPVLVSRGLCPSDLAGFLNQQYRWCMGSLTKTGPRPTGQGRLTLRQQVSFWSGLLYYVSTALNVFALAVPGIIMTMLYPGDVRAIDFVPLMAGAWVYFVLLPRVSTSRWRFEVIRVQLAYSFCHVVALAHKARGHQARWVPTGATGKKSNLALSISVLGATTLTLVLLLSWGTIAMDIPTYGLYEFWPLALFMAGYTYLAIPLIRDFASIVFVSRQSKPSTRRGSRKGAHRAGLPLDLAVMR
jgi:cellulose synthase (UDP-forming)